MTGPNADVQAAYAAYLAAEVEVANLPGVSEQSATQAAQAQEAQYRLYEADKAHSEAWHAAHGSAAPETAAGWQAKYPLLNMEHRGVPTAYDLGLEPEAGS